MISVVIPIYNEEEIIALLHDAVSTAMRQTGETWEVVYINDGSKDSSLELLRQLQRTEPEVVVVDLSRNWGHMGALHAGLQTARGDAIVLMDGDLQDPPELIPGMVDRWLQGTKFIICKRSARDDPPGSRLFAFIFYKLVRFFVVEDYPSRGYDLALMDRALLPYLQNTSKNINPPLFAYWLGFEPEVMLYERKKRVFGKSRWTFRSKVKLFLDSLLGFSVAPIRMISLVGFLVSLASLGYGIWIVFNALRGKTVVQGFATIVTITSLLLGLIIIMLGVIGEYVWRIFDEINKRPESVIDEIY